MLDEIIENSSFGNINSIMREIMFRRLRYCGQKMMCVCMSMVYKT